MAADFEALSTELNFLRGLRDRDALRAGLADGAVDAICSDHTPLDEDAKQVPFAEAEPGATGLELLLPLIGIAFPKTPSYQIKGDLDYSRRQDPLPRLHRPARFE